MRRSAVMGDVYRLKATLLGTAPPVWRRVLVPGESTLAEVHDVLQAAFGWGGYHLHEFEVGGARYGVPDDDDDDDEWDDDPLIDEDAVRLDAVAQEGSTLHYTYDFGDDWQHELVVEEVAPGTSDTVAPACIDGGRACPPEDCGGITGYRHLLDVLADPTHPDHAEQLGWVGGAFDPEAFDPSGFEERLALVRIASFDD